MAALRRPLPPVDPLNPRCYFDLTLAGEPAGRLIFELFVDRAPAAAENFRVLCTGERGVCAATGRALCYAGSAVGRLVAGEALYGGALPHHGAATSAPDGRDSAYGDFFEPDADSLPHDRAGLLSTQPLRDGAACAASQFALTLGQTPARDALPGGARATVFGRLIRGYGALRHLEAQPTRADGAPAQPLLIAACGELPEGDDGVVLGADGDPFPEWPQDAPGLIGDSSPGEAYAARAAAAETLRALGNEAFRAGDFKTADAKYSKALRYLERSHHSRDAETMRDAAEAARLHAALGVPLLLNAAAARLRLRDGRGAVAACDEVWRLENEAPNGGISTAAQLGGGVWNAKALFRRGAGLALCREYEEAERELSRAAVLAPGDAAVAAELRRVRAAAQARRQRERNAFAGAFGGA